jgi:hypothetical protein
LRKEDKEWWNMGIWRLKGVRGNFGQGLCPVGRKVEGRSHILRCEETRNWRDRLLEKLELER